MSKLYVLLRIQTDTAEVPACNFYVTAAPYETYSFPTTFVLGTYTRTEFTHPSTKRIYRVFADLNRGVAEMTAVFLAVSLDEMYARKHFGTVRSNKAIIKSGRRLYVPGDVECSVVFADGEMFHWDVFVRLDIRDDDSVICKGFEGVREVFGEAERYDDEEGDEYEARMLG